MKHFVILSLLCFAVTGCQRSDAPNDLPKLYPCTVTVTQDGKPLAEAVVRLVSADTAQKYTPASITGADGSVALSTYGFPGVPAGKYKVVFQKNIEDDLVYETNGRGVKEVVAVTEYRTIEKKFSDAETTPHEIEITPDGKKNQAAFELGKAVKERL